MRQFEEQYKDFLFEYEEIEPIGPHWIFGFDNGYGLSIITETYKNNPNTYEVALMKVTEDGVYEMYSNDDISKFSGGVIQGQEDIDLIEMLEQVKNIGKDEKDNE